MRCFRCSSQSDVRLGVVQDLNRDQHWHQRYLKFKWSVALVSDIHVPECIQTQLICQSPRDLVKCTDVRQQFHWSVTRARKLPCSFCFNWLVRWLFFFPNRFQHQIATPSRCLNISNPGIGLLCSRGCQCLVCLTLGTCTSSTTP